MKLSKNDLLILLNSYMYGNRMVELKEDVQKLIDNLLSNKLEIEGYEKTTRESFSDKTLSLYNEI